MWAQLQVCISVATIYHIVCENSHNFILKKNHENYYTQCEQYFNFVLKKREDKIMKIITLNRNNTS